MYPASRALSSKHAARPLLLSMDGKDTRTDGRTDGRTLDRSINPALRMFAKKTAAGKHCMGMKYAYLFSTTGLC